MPVWLSYVITFIGSLTVALVTVWISQRWSAKRDYLKALRNLRSEVVTNIRASNLICEWVNRNVEALNNGQLVVASCPHLYDLAWSAIKGDMAKSDRDIVVRLEELYLQIVVVNNLLQTIEELKWGAAGAMTGIRQRRINVLEAIKDIVGEIILPQLEDARRSLDKRLKLGSSQEVEGGS